MKSAAGPSTCGALNRSASRTITSLGVRGPKSSKTGAAFGVRSSWRPQHPCMSRKEHCEGWTRVESWNHRLDARLIAEYVAIMPTRVVQRDDAVERLAEIVTMRRQAV
jgi:hypothetical protein